MLHLSMSGTVFVVIAVSMFLLEYPVLGMNGFAHLVGVFEQAFVGHLEMFHIMIKDNVQFESLRQIKFLLQHQKSYCVVCGKKFNSSKNLKRHGKVHEIKRCQECGKNFNSKKDLRMHQKEHRKKRVNLEEEYFTDNSENAEFVMANMAMDNLPDIDNATLALLKITF